MLSVVKTKITFGKDDLSLKIEFSWSDVLRAKYDSSNNINFEYYSCLFNLGILYNLMGESLKNSSSGDDLEVLKEAIKYFQNSAGIFDKIKSEITTYISLKELPLDLSANYLSYVNKSFNFYF
jgi:hypothetical protein